MWDRIATIAARRRTALSVAAAVRFWSGCAICAGFVSLPAVPEAVGLAYSRGAAAANAIWWGAARPTLKSRRRGRTEREAGPH